MEVYGRLWMFDWHILFESECLCVLECKSAPWPRGTVKGIMTWEKGVNETPWRVWKLALRSKFCLPVLWPGISDKASWGRAVERDVLDQSHPSPVELVSLPCLAVISTLTLQSNLTLPLMLRTDTCPCWWAQYFRNLLFGMLYLRMSMCETNRLKLSFVPASIKLLNLTKNNAPIAY